jgi:phage repressor protein C with HTH and peptisase S24 domain
MADYKQVVIDNILSIIEEKGISQSDLSNMTGIDKGNLSAILKGSKSLGDKTLLKFSQVLGISYEDLKNPDENIINKRKEKHIIKRKNTYQVNTVQTPDLSSKIPYFDIDVTAGNVQLFSDYQEYVSDYYSVPKEIQDVDFCFKVRGDSMYDKILPGAIVFVKEITDISVIEFGQVFIVITAEQRLVKYVRRHPTKPEDMVLLRSHNNQYDDIDLPKNKIRNLLLVKGYLNNYVL